MEDMDRMAVGFVYGGTMGARRMSPVCSCSRGDEGLSRRTILRFGASIAASVAVEASAGALPKSREELMSQLGSKKTPEEIEEEKAQKAEERRLRLERQRALMEEQERKKAEGPGDNESELDANLRANYYFPTARKRYLPRIKDCADKIDAAKEAMAKSDWKAVQLFAEGPADSASGPLKLYASSLAGQGLSLKVAYVEDMNNFADAYEKQLKKLTKAIKKKKTAEAKGALDALDEALQGYRKAAKIDTPDGGIGEIPTDKRLGSGMSYLIPRKLD